jgi:hypothetical protein
MSQKFDMKLVIDEVTTPLLHTRLSQANSYRERAALLRSLAESALRGDHALASVYPAATAAARLGDRAATSPQGLSSIQDSRPSDVTAVHQNAPIDYSGHQEANEERVFEGHDVDQIADAFGSFF